jgi:ATP-dependent Lon protease
MRIAEGFAGKILILPADLHAILGPKRFENEVADRTSVPGVPTGLAWTPVGGDILFVEATRIPGSGRLILTGQLGDVMRESAQAALSLVKSRASSFGIEPNSFEKSDIHIHVPAGAIPKDGPSAGVTMATALSSLLSGRHVRDDTAMTGELTLTGQVLPIGGLKEKGLAAQAAGMERVIAPKLNRQDIDDIPKHLMRDLEFIWVDRIEEVLDNALEQDGAQRNGRAPRRAAARAAAKAGRSKAPARSGARPG